MTTKTPAAAPSIADRLGSAIILEALAKRLAAAAAAYRAENVAALRDEYEADGTLTKSARVPGTSVQLGKVTLTIPKERMVVTDPIAFAAWVAQRDPSAVTYQPTVLDSTQKAILGNAEAAPGLDDDARKVAVNKDGEVIPGVQVMPAAAPSSYSVRSVDQDAITAWLLEQPGLDAFLQSMNQVESGEQGGEQK